MQLKSKIEEQKIIALNELSLAYMVRKDALSEQIDQLTQLESSKEHVLLHIRHIIDTAEDKHKSIEGLSELVMAKKKALHDQVDAVFLNGYEELRKNLASSTGAFFGAAKSSPSKGTETAASVSISLHPISQSSLQIVFSDALFAEMLSNFAQLDEHACAANSVVNNLRHVFYNDEIFEENLLAFELIASNKSGTIRSTGGDMITVSLSSPLEQPIETDKFTIVDGIQEKLYPIEMSINDQSNGKYDVVLKPKERLSPGKYTLEIRMNGELLQRKRFYIEIFDDKDRYMEALKKEKEESEIDRIKGLGISVPDPFGTHNPVISYGISFGFSSALSFSANPTMGISAQESSFGSNFMLGFPTANPSFVSKTNASSYSTGVRKPNNPRGFKK